ncbi:hypothetical protein LNP25_18680 [Klebsiella variicola subsp. variicola]|nr:hypothetical protein [Klebsiella variicola subsp. variicola]
MKIDYRWTGNFLLTLSRMPRFGRLDNNIYYMQGYSGHGVTCTHLAGRLISELLRGDAERFDAFAKLPHYPFPGGRSLRIPFLPPWAPPTTACATALGFNRLCRRRWPSAHAADSAAESSGAETPRWCEF